MLTKETELGARVWLVKQYALPWIEGSAEYGTAIWGVTAFPKTFVMQDKKCSIVADYEPSEPLRLENLKLESNADLFLNSDEAHQEADRRRELGKQNSNKKG